MEKKAAERLAELIDTLKPLPQVATLVVEKCADPNAGVREVADVLRSDPAFTAKVLSVANSVFYRGEKEIKTAKDAVARIGLKALRNIVYSTAVYNLFSKKNERPASFDREGFWLHSLSVAVCAKQIAARLGYAEDEAFTTGLLHDIGKIIIDQAATEPAGDGKASKLETVLLEDDDALVEGFDPAEVGYRAAQKWHLPAGVQKAIAYIRVEDLEFIGDENGETLVRVVQSSNAFCEDLAHLGTPHREFLEAYAARFGMPDTEIEGFVAEVRREVADAAGLFQLTDRDVHRYFDAISTAQNELSKSKLGAAS